MATRSLTHYMPEAPSLFDNFFKPWNEWFDNGNQWNIAATVPAVNITENKEDYKISLAAPGMKKDDFRVDVDNNMLTISSEKEESKEEKEGKYTRKEYNYSSFSRSFTLPDGVEREKIDAQYANGVLEIRLPKKAEALKTKNLKQITVK